MKKISFKKINFKKMAKHILAVLGVVLVVVTSTDMVVEARWVAGAEKDMVNALENGWVPEANIMQSIRNGDATPTQVEYVVSKGYLTSYLEELKTNGWLRQDYGAAPVVAPPSTNTPATPPAEPELVVKAYEPKAYMVEDMQAVMYATGPVNVRDGAYSDYHLIGGLEKDQEVAVTGRANTGWYRIDFNGSDGYVSEKYLTDTKPLGESTATEPTSEAESVAVMATVEAISEEPTSVEAVSEEPTTVTEATTLEEPTSFEEPIQQQGKASTLLMITLFCAAAFVVITTVIFVIKRIKKKTE